LKRKTTSTTSTTTKKTIKTNIGGFVKSNMLNMRPKIKNNENDEVDYKGEVVAKTSARSSIEEELAVLREKRKSLDKEVIAKPVFMMANGKQIWGSRTKNLLAHALEQHGGSSNGNCIGKLMP
jgi:hypothetical protein